MNVVFDIGMVLIEWDPRHLYRKVFKSEADMEWFLTHVCHPEWNLAQDHGRTFAEGRREATTRHPKHAAEIAMFDERWMDMVPGEISGTVDILETLHKRGTPLYAITNFSSEKFGATRQRFPFLNLFRDIVVSGDEKLIKPDPTIYQLLAKRNKIDLADSIFIDDSLKNVKGAEAVGMKAHHFTTPESLRTDLAKYGLL